jgi:hypothetical protein
MPRTSHSKSHARRNRWCGMRERHMAFQARRSVGPFQKRPLHPIGESVRMAPNPLPSEPPLHEPQHMRCTQPWHVVARSPPVEPIRKGKFPLPCGCITGCSLRARSSAVANDAHPPGLQTNLCRDIPPDTYPHMSNNNGLLYQHERKVKSA